MNKGETRKIKVTFPTDYSSKELAGKDADFTVTLKEIKKKVLPELNDEFAKDIGGNKSVDELKAGIKKDLEAEKTRRAGLGPAGRAAVEAGRRPSPSTFLRAWWSVNFSPWRASRPPAWRGRGMDVKSFDVAKFL